MSADIASRERSAESYNKNNSGRDEKKEIRNGVLLVFTYHRRRRMLGQIVRRLVQTSVGRGAARERILVAQRAAAHRRIEAERVAPASAANTTTSSSSCVMAHHRAPVGAQVNVLQHLQNNNNANIWHKSISHLFSKQQEMANPRAIFLLPPTVLLTICSSYAIELRADERDVEYELSNCTGASRAHRGTSIRSNSHANCGLNLILQPQKPSMTPSAPGKNRNYYGLQAKYLAARITLRQEDLEEFSTPPLQPEEEKHYCNPSLRVLLILPKNIRREKKVWRVIPKAIRKTEFIRTGHGTQRNFRQYNHHRLLAEKHQP
ncbi:hypothetical protein DAPPUDRAFT_245351 [Daphnia pulex]|uniref:Uncharacterized protein n=1 Tax=Daphnia pulex TaxID=6669 RepID=E9GN62_DAPPU|nr:hypothetical protein DAPPUDRAFT_245351 [Daphnia pulex]|eukprot:EFX78979.1 hypothetical protein DAPPUDRAFT_245351 [Daphnia pulex]